MSEKKGTPLLKSLLLEHRLPWRYDSKFKKLSKGVYYFLWHMANNKLVGKYEKKLHMKYVKSVNLDYDASSVKKPNIILIILDTVRAQDIPMYGGKTEMPFLTKFAAHSTTYKNAYTSFISTIASHAALFTGLYPSNHGLLKGSQKLGMAFPTMAELLKKQGYGTFCITDNILICPENDLTKGFDHYIQTHHIMGGAERKINKFLPLLKEKKPYLLFINFITAHQNYFINPCFFKGLSKKEIKEVGTQCTYNLRYNEEDAALIKDKWHKAYLSTLEYLDFQLAKLFYKLDKNDLLTDSLVIITSDHGEEILDHKIKHDDGDFYTLQHKVSYNTTMKIPLLIKHLSKKDKESDVLVNNIDIFPTVFDEFGLKIDNKIDGISILSSKQDFIISQNLFLKYNVIVKGDFKMMNYQNHAELFNLKSDPYETNPVENNKIKKDMLQILSKFTKEPIKSAEKVNKDDEAKMKEKLKALGYI